MNHRYLAQHQARAYVSHSGTFSGSLNENVDEFLITLEVVFATLDFDPIKKTANTISLLKGESSVIITAVLQSDHIVKSKLNIFH